MALGASTSILIPPEGVRAIIPRIIGGLKNLHVEPRGAHPLRPINGETNTRVDRDQQKHRHRVRSATPRLVAIALAACVVGGGLYFLPPQVLIERDPQALFEPGQERLTKGDLSGAIAD